MNQLIFVINGSGGSGKDTICRFAAEQYLVCNVSSITPIVEIAQYAGWDGRKTPEARRLLSRLKEAFTEYNDLSFRFCIDQYKTFLSSKNQILFVHIREPEEIRRFKDYVGQRCQTILVRRAARQKKFGNHSDDGVENFKYDFYIDNNGTLDELKRKTLSLLSALK